MWVPHKIFLLLFSLIHSYLAENYQFLHVFCHGLLKIWIFFAAIFFITWYFLWLVMMQLFCLKSIKLTPFHNCLSLFSCRWFFKCVVYSVNMQIFCGNFETQYFFLDWFPNYEIYCIWFSIFEAFSLPVSEIFIVLWDTAKIRIYSTCSWLVFLNFSRPISDVGIFLCQIFK